MARILLNIVFVFSVIFIWLMLIYQFFLTIGGFLLNRKIIRESRRPREDSPLPPVSILIPARNEAKVIEGLLRAIGNLDYPQDRLQVIVINDGSTDGTAEIVDRLSRTNPAIRLIDIPPHLGGRGKGAALNQALPSAAHDLIAVYDADNLPEPGSLARLSRALMAEPRLAAVTGKFRAYNKNKNLLTRLINLESISFQWIIQAGRSFFLNICFLPGTNFIVRKSALTEAGGWDEAALTEDAELTLRLYEKGRRIKFLPTAVSWEQEPETLKAWVAQRTRWARGNTYLIAAHGRRLLRFPLKLMSIEILNLLYLYYFFVMAILFSDILFVLSLFGVVHIRVPGPYLQLWGLAFLLFLMEVLVALAFEDEDSWSSLGLAVVAYLTYTKLWVFIVIKSVLEEYVFRSKKTWVKTERVEPNPPRIKEKP